MKLYKCVIYKELAFFKQICTDEQLKKAEVVMHLNFSLNDIPNFNLIHGTWGVSYLITNKEHSWQYTIYTYLLSNDLLEMVSPAP